MATVRMTVAFNVDFSEELVPMGIQRLMEFPNESEGTANMIWALTSSHCDIENRMRLAFLAAFLKDRPEVAKDHARLAELAPIAPLYWLAGGAAENKMPPELFREYVTLKLKYSVDNESKWFWKRKLEKVNEDLSSCAAPA